MLSNPPSYQARLEGSRMAQPNTALDLNKYAKLLSRTPDLLRTVLERFPDPLLEAS
jgi:hypothetical protein